MRLWTFQPETVYDILIQDGVFHCDEAKSENIVEYGFDKAYGWLAAEMKKRIGAPPRGIKYPIWAWHTINWKHSKPDLRMREFYFSEPMLCIEIEMPDNEVLLSNEDSWHIVLNDSYYSDSEEDWENYESFPLLKQEKTKDASWRKIFDIVPYENEWVCKGRYIQATFWELKKESIVSVRKVKPKYR